MASQKNRYGLRLPPMQDACGRAPMQDALWRLAAATVIWFASQSGVQANHCPAESGSQCCWKTVPDPHPSADKGFFWICDYPDNCHYRCYQSQGDEAANACKAAGSVLDLDNQALSEAINITGTPFFLRYYSDRVPGRLAGSKFTWLAGRLVEAAGMGGWVLNVHHLYDIPTKTFWSGDGTHIDVGSLGGALPSGAQGNFLIRSRDAGAIYVFDRRGLLQQTLSDLTGAIVYQFAHNGSDQLVSITDRNGNKTEIERDSAGHPTAIVSPYGHRTAMAFDANGYLQSVTNPATETVTLSYTADGLLLTRTDQNGPPKRYDYDLIGRLIRETDQGGSAQTLQRTNSPFGFDLVFTDRSGRSTSLSVTQPGGAGQERSIAFPGGVTSHMTGGGPDVGSVLRSDGLGASGQSAADPRWGATSPFLQMQQIGSSDGSQSLSIEMKIDAQMSDPADPLSLVQETETITVGTDGHAYRRKYDATSRTLTITSPAGRVRTIRFDDRGRVQSEQRPGLEPTTFSYSDNGLLAGISGGPADDARSASLSYAVGLLKSVTDPAGISESFLYDAAGRRTHRDVDGSAGIAYGYDGFGNLASVTPPGRPPHVLTYSDVGTLSSYTPPTVPGSAAIQYSYDPGRQLTGITASDLAVTMDYGADGQLTAVRSGDQVFAYSYEPSNGRMTQAVAPDGETKVFGYGTSILLGRLSWSGSVQGTVDIAYDAQFRRISETIAGTTVAYSYDPDGGRSKAGDLTIERDAASSLVVGRTLQNLAEQRSYNRFGELVDVSVTFKADPSAPGQVVANFHYTRDKLGRIQQEDQAGSKVAYAYDRAGRLSERHTVDQAGRDSVQETFGYDSNGNRVALTTPSGSTASAFDDQDRLSRFGERIYTYTAGGDLADFADGNQRTAFTYDALGDVKEVHLPDGRVVSYIVDGEGRRVGKRIDNVLVRGFLYSEAGQLVAELDKNGSVASRFVYGTGNDVPDYMAKGGRDYLIVGDETGGPRAVIDAQSGVAVQKLEYSGFGMVLSDSGPGFQPFGFAGGVYDGDTSMLHFQFRDYDPQAGRWLSRDPAWFSAESSNLYQYALNDPVNRRDAKGLADSEEHSWWSRIKEIWEAHDWAKKAVEEDTPPGAMEEYRQVGQPAVENLNGVDGLLKRMQALWRKCSNALGGDDSGGQAPRPVDSGAPPRVTPGPRSTPRQWSPDSVY